MPSLLARIGGLAVTDARTGLNRVADAERNDTTRDTDTAQHTPSYSLRSQSANEPSLPPELPSLLSIGVSSTANQPYPSRPDRTLLLPADPRLPTNMTSDARPTLPTTSTEGDMHIDTGSGAEPALSRTDLLSQIDRMATDIVGGGDLDRRNPMDRLSSSPNTTSHHNATTSVDAILRAFEQRSSHVNKLHESFEQGFSNWMVTMKASEIATGDLFKSVDVIIKRSEETHTQIARMLAEVETTRTLATQLKAEIGELQTRVSHAQAEQNSARDTITQLRDRISQDKDNHLADEERSLVGALYVEIERLMHARDDAEMRAASAERAKEDAAAAADRKIASLEDSQEQLRQQATLSQTAFDHLREQLFNALQQRVETATVRSTEDTRLNGQATAPHNRDVPMNTPHNGDSFRSAVIPSGYLSRSNPMDATEQNVQSATDTHAYSTASAIQNHPVAPMLNVQKLTSSNTENVPLPLTAQHSHDDVAMNDPIPSQRTSHSDVGAERRPTLFNNQSGTSTGSPDIPIKQEPSPDDVALSPNNQGVEPIPLSSGYPALSSATVNAELHDGRSEEIMNAAPPRQSLLERAEFTVDTGTMYQSADADTTYAENDRYQIQANRPDSSTRQGHPRVNNGDRSWRTSEANNRYTVSQDSLQSNRQSRSPSRQLPADYSTYRQYDDDSDSPIPRRRYGDHYEPSPSPTVPAKRSHDGSSYVPAYESRRHMRARSSFSPDRDWGRGPRRYSPDHEPYYRTHDRYATAYRHSSTYRGSPRPRSRSTVSPPNSPRNANPRVDTYAMDAGSWQYEGRGVQGDATEHDGNQLQYEKGYSNNPTSVYAPEPAGNTHESTDTGYEAMSRDAQPMSIPPYSSRPRVDRSRYSEHQQERTLHSRENLPGQGRGAPASNTRPELLSRMQDPPYSKFSRNRGRVQDGSYGSSTNTSQRAYGTAGDSDSRRTRTNAYTRNTFQRPNQRSNAGENIGNERNGPQPGKSLASRIASNKTLERRISKG